MTVPRRKSDIRALAKQEVGRLKAARGDAQSRDWRVAFLNALIDGRCITHAAAVAGIKRSRVYDAQRNPAFNRAMQLARYYGDNGIKWVSRPIWPPSPETVQRHEATFQRIAAVQRNQLVGRGF